MIQIRNAALTVAAQDPNTNATRADATSGSIGEPSSSTNTSSAAVALGTSGFAHFGAPAIATKLDLFKPEPPPILPAPAQQNEPATAGVGSTPVWGTVQEAVQEEAERQAVEQALSNVINGGSQQENTAQEQAQALGDAAGDALRNGGQSATEGPQAQNPPNLGTGQGYSEQEQMQELGNFVKDALTDRGQSTTGGPPAQNPPDLDIGPGYSPQKQAQGIWDAAMSQSSAAPALPGWVDVSTETGSKAADSGPHKPILHPR